MAAAYDAPFPEPRAKQAARAFPLMLPTEPTAPGAEAGQKVLAALKEDTRPKLFLWADSDPMLTLKTGARFAEVCGTEIDHVIPDASHFLQEDQGELIGRHIADWLAPRRRRAALTDRARPLMPCQASCSSSRFGIDAIVQRSGFSERSSSSSQWSGAATGASGRGLTAYGGTACCAYRLRSTSTKMRSPRFALWNSVVSFFGCSSASRTDDRLRERERLLERHGPDRDGHVDPAGAGHHRVRRQA